ncbi:MgtC/SapB family protein [Paenibacillus thalictri]|uniref:Magnesium transporter MgtC n=1 Tax=Paenibacillus thalictri TaxID=2527873 RepID=A0A4Q9DFM9_9BACL|nr:MgtC/SapB family protein [Paenibacillus thalictri]TBL70857.1 magnesium transporter MgtC [Paenibacillus thalictri]
MTGVASIWTITHWELLVRMVLAVVLGGIVGMEREWHNHAAGFRTHILVCLGSATIMLLSIYGFSEFVNETNVRVDPARLAAQVISGIGFLGAGAILRNGSVISGLTTAASVWVVAAIGLCVGAGFLYAAFCATLLVLVSLLVLNKWEKYLMRNRRNHELTINAVDQPGVLGKIASTFGELDIQIVNVKMIHVAETAAGHADKPTIKLCFSLKVSNQAKFITAMERIGTLDFVLWMESDGKPMVHSNGLEQTH